MMGGDGICWWCLLVVYVGVDGVSFVRGVGVDGVVGDGKDVMEFHWWQ